MSVHKIHTIVILMQTAQTPMEVSRVSATQASLEMEQHVLILMSVH